MGNAASICFDAQFPATDDTINWSETSPGLPPGARSSTSRFPVANASASATLTSVTYIPAAAIVGDDTDSRTLQLYSADGTYDALGSPFLVAELALVSGVDVAAGDPLDIPIIEAALSQFVFWKTLKVGGGLRDPGGTLKVRWS